MKQFWIALAAVTMIVFSCIALYAQTSTATFQWDFVASLATVGTYQQEVRIDGVRQSAIPTCVERVPGETTCSIPVTLSPGPHTLTVTAQANGVSATATLPNVDLSTSPRPTHPRVVITVTVP